MTEPGGSDPTGVVPPDLEGNGSAVDPAVAYDATISMVAANLIAIGLLPLFVAVLLLPFWLVWGSAVLGAGFRSVARLEVMIPLFLGLVVVHEGLHAAGFLGFAHVRREDIRFGINWKALSPYAHCRAAVRAGAYKLAVALPGFVLGVVPAVIGLLTGDAWLALWGFFMVIAAAGDVAILWAIRGVPRDAIVRDHPSRAGCQVLAQTPADGIPEGL
ncbi:MAG: DUF3267 domain-containing protein [Ignavibacteria bacterium]|nr:DUF3267 domain-containing protein [Ignavibacteria bacterium]